MVDERRLWAAVLLRAIEDLAGHCTPASRAQREHLRYHADLWIASDRRDVGSFLWICDELAIKPACIRRHVRASNGSIGPRGLSFTTLRSFLESASEDIVKCSLPG
jgi:hypothetical protein